MINFDPNQLAGTHTAVLSRLNYTQYKDGFVHFYDASEFEKGLSSFNENLILFAKRHPRKGFRGRPIEDVLEETEGKIVGLSKQAIINNMGSPKLQSVLEIYDPDVEAKIKSGDIKISPGFWCNAPRIGTLTGIAGDHVLLYESATGAPPQGDVAAMIVNQDTDYENEQVAYFGFSEAYIKGEGETMTEKELDTVLQILKQNQDELHGKVLEREKDMLKLADEIEKKDAEILKLNQDITEKDSRITELETHIKEEKVQMLKNQQDDFWNSLLEGTRKHFEDRKIELTDSEKYLKLNQDILAYERNLAKPVIKEAEGNPNLVNNQGSIDDEDLKALREMRSITGR